MNAFDDMIDDDLDAFPSVVDNAPTYTEICRKCAGKGRVLIGYVNQRWATCFACKGAGKFERKSSPEARAAAKAKRIIKKANDEAANWDAFKVEFPEVAGWMVESANFEFAQSLRAAVIKYGSLTTNQMAAAVRCVEKLNAKKAERQQQAAQQEANKTQIAIDRVYTALTTAQSNGLKWPKLRLVEYTFSLAPSYGRNAGAVYVKNGEVYLGKVVSGQFLPSRDCGTEQRDAIVAACADPEAAAVAYGKRTGVCSCCGRELTNAESIARGIGPICAAKFGW